jgi:hypothetical protein
MATPTWYEQQSVAGWLTHAHLEDFAGLGRTTIARLDESVSDLESE